MNEELPDFVDVEINAKCVYKNDFGGTQQTL